MDKKKIIIPNGPVFKDFGIARLPTGTYICPGWIKIPDGTTRDDVMFENPWPFVDTRFFVTEFVGATGTYSVTISPAGNRCTCPGFSFRKKCRHIEEVKKI